VLDRERVLGKLDALHGMAVNTHRAARNLDEYTVSVEKRRATERLLQVLLSASSTSVGSLSLDFASDCLQGGEPLRSVRTGARSLA